MQNSRRLKEFEADKILTQLCEVHLRLMHWCNGVWQKAMLVERYTRKIPWNDASNLYTVWINCSAVCHALPCS